MNYKNVINYNCALIVENTGKLLQQLAGLRITLAALPALKQCPKRVEII
jgi:hypothetical protein